MLIAIKKMVSIVAIASILFITACSTDNAPPQSAPLRQVRYITVEGTQAGVERSFAGSLQSTNQTSYSFRVSGRIASIAVQVGQSVSDGQVLATLDPTDYELQVQRSRAALLESQSNQRKSQANYERTKKLYVDGNSSRSDLDNARAAAETANAAAEAARKSLQISERDLGYTQLRSDGACQIAAVPGDSGENVNAGVEVVVANCGEGLEVALNVPESVITRIEPKMPVTVTFPAFPRRDLAGQVNEIGVSSIGNGTTFPVTVLLDSSEGLALKSGLSANVTFTLGNDSTNGEAVTIVPSFAVSEDQEGRFVYIVESDENNRHFVRRTAVSIGELQQGGIVVREGIQPGMRLVTAGVSVLRDGLEVKVSE